MEVDLSASARSISIAAEADVGLGNTAEAATFVNVLHTRAASAAHKNDYNVTAAQMTLDYIMEERERELAGEHNALVRHGASGRAVLPRPREEVQPARRGERRSSSTRFARFRSRRSTA